VSLILQSATHGYQHGTLEGTGVSLRVTLVDGEPERAALLRRALEDAGHQVVARLAPGENLLAGVESSLPDIIIIDVDSPDRDILESLRHLHTSAPRPVIMFAANDDTEVIERAIHSGVSAYVVDGLSSHRVKAVMEVAIARFREFQALRDELHKTQCRLADRKDVDVAKSLLMSHKGMAEPEAYQALRKLAMDRNQTVGEVARNLIAVMRILD
jgi:response regulator NasT